MRKFLMKCATMVLVAVMVMAVPTFVNATPDGGGVAGVAHESFAINGELFDMFNFMDDRMYGHGDIQYAGYFESMGIFNEYQIEHIRRFAHGDAGAGITWLTLEAPVHIEILGGTFFDWGMLAQTQEQWDDVIVDMHYDDYLGAPTFTAPTSFLIPQAGVYTFSLRRAGDFEFIIEVVDGGTIEALPVPTPAPAVTVPTIAAAGLVTTDRLVTVVPPAPTAGQDLQYTVQYGETLWTIAFNFYGSMQTATINRILNANRDVVPANGILTAGMVLTLPAQGLRDPITRTHLYNAAGLYLVQAGDTLGSIANYFFGNPADWRRIHEANRTRIPNANRIYEGQWIVIPQ